MGVCPHFSDAPGKASCSVAEVGGRHLDLHTACLRESHSPELCYRFQRARAETAEARVAELEIPGNEGEIAIFTMLWTAYGSEADDKLAPSGLRLKKQLREIIGIEAYAEAVRELVTRVRFYREMDVSDEFTRAADETALARAAALNLPEEGE